jgi:hypothetical protein
MHSVLVGRSDISSYAHKHRMVLRGLAPLTPAISCSVNSLASNLECRGILGNGTKEVHAHHRSILRRVNQDIEM